MYSTFSSLSGLIAKFPLAGYFDAAVTRVARPSVKVDPVHGPSLIEFARNDLGYCNAVLGTKQSHTLSGLLCERERVRAELTKCSLASAWRQIFSLPEVARAQAAARVMTAQSVFIGCAYIAGSLAPVCFPAGFFAGVGAWILSNRVLRSALDNQRISRNLIPGLNDEDRDLAKKQILGEGYDSGFRSGLSKLFGIVGAVDLSFGAQFYAYSDSLIQNGERSLGFLVPGMFLMGLVSAAVYTLNFSFGLRDEASRIFNSRQVARMPLEKKVSELDALVRSARPALTLTGAKSVLACYPSLRYAYLNERYLPLLRGERSNLQRVRERLCGAIPFVYGAYDESIAKLDVAIAKLNAKIALVEAQLPALNTVRGDMSIQAPYNESDRQKLGMTIAADLASANQVLARAGEFLN